MDPRLPSQLEEAGKALYSPSSSAEGRKKAEKFLNDFQSNRSREGILVTLQVVKEAAGKGHLDLGLLFLQMLLHKLVKIETRLGTQEAELLYGELAQLLKKAGQNGPLTRQMARVFAILICMRDLNPDSFFGILETFHPDSPDLTLSILGEIPVVLELSRSLKKHFLPQAGPVATGIFSRLGGMLEREDVARVLGEWVPLTPTAALEEATLWTSQSLLEKLFLRVAESPGLVARGGVAFEEMVKSVKCSCSPGAAPLGQHVTLLSFSAAQLLKVRPERMNIDSKKFVIEQMSGISILLCEMGEVGMVRLVLSPFWESVRTELTSDGEGKIKELSRSLDLSPLLLALSKICEWPPVADDEQFQEFLQFRDDVRQILRKLVFLAPNFFDALLGISEEYSLHALSALSTAYKEEFKSCAHKKEKFVKFLENFLDTEVNLEQAASSEESKMFLCCLCVLFTQYADIFDQLFVCKIQKFLCLCLHIPCPPLLEWTQETGIPFAAREDHAAAVALWTLKKFHRLESDPTSRGWDWPRLEALRLSRKSRLLVVESLSQSCSSPDEGVRLLKTSIVSVQDFPMFLKSSPFCEEFLRSGLIQLPEIGAVCPDAIPGVISACAPFLTLAEVEAGVNGTKHMTLQWAHAVEDIVKHGKISKVITAGLSEFLKGKEGGEEVEALFLKSFLRIPGGSFKEFFSDEVLALWVERSLARLQGSGKDDLPRVEFISLVPSLLLLEDSPRKVDLLIQALKISFSSISRNLPWAGGALQIFSDLAGGLRGGALLEEAVLRAVRLQWDGMEEGETWKLVAKIIANPGDKQKVKRAIKAVQLKK